MSGLAGKGAGLNLENIEHHQSVTERHPNLVFRFAYLMDMEGVDPFNISGVDREKESEQRKGRGRCYRSDFPKKSLCRDKKR